LLFKKYNYINQEILFLKYPNKNTIKEIKYKIPIIGSTILSEKLLKQINQKQSHSSEKIKTTCINNINCYKNKNSIINYIR